MPDASSTVIWVYNIATSTPSQNLALYSLWVLRSLTMFSVAYGVYCLVSAHKSR